MLRRPSGKLLLAASLGLLAACNGSTSPEQREVAEVQVAKPKLGLFTTLPIYWGEAGDITEMLNSDAEPDELEKFEIVPLDTSSPRRWRD